MPSISLVFFLTIEDEENKIGLVTKESNVPIVLNDEQQERLLVIVREMLNEAKLDGSL
jgi:hypothetical protein